MGPTAGTPGLRNSTEKKPNLLFRVVSESRFGQEISRVLRMALSSRTGLENDTGGHDSRNRPDANLSVRSQCDRRSDPLGWSWRRSRSASRAGRHDGPRELTCHHDAPGRQPLPIQIQSAQVRVSWTSVHSSTKTPHEQKRDPNFQVNAPLLPFAEGNTSSTRHRHPGIDQASRYGSAKLPGGPPSRFAQPGPDLPGLSRITTLQGESR